MQIFFVDEVVDTSNLPHVQWHELIPFLTAQTLLPTPLLTVNTNVSESAGICCFFPFLEVFHIFLILKVTLLTRTGRMKIYRC